MEYINSIRQNKASAKIIIAANVNNIHNKL